MNLQPHVEKIKHRGTKEKVYIPCISGKRLHVWWKTKTNAKLYAQAVLARYYKKLRVHIEHLKAQQLEETKNDKILTDAGRDESPVSESSG